VVVISTPNGQDPIYYEIYDQALRKMNDFKISEMFWYKDPRYTKDLYMVKTTDLVHYLLNREEYSEDKIVDLSVDNPYLPHKVIEYSSGYYVFERGSLDLKTEIWQGDYFKIELDA
jgi:hypothetical protein